jgi:hypothetical protein
MTDFKCLICLEWMIWINEMDLDIEHWNSLLILELINSSKRSMNYAYSWIFVSFNSILINVQIVWDWMHSRWSWSNVRYPDFYQFLEQLLIRTIQKDQEEIKICLWLLDQSRLPIMHFTRINCPRSIAGIDLCIWSHFDPWSFWIWSSSGQTPGHQSDLS